LPGGIGWKLSSPSPLNEPLVCNGPLSIIPSASSLSSSAREGRDTLAQELGITVEKEHENEKSADIFTRLRIHKDQVPIKPLIQGKLE
jgi:hypothetical protein